VDCTGEIRGRNYVTYLLRFMKVISFRKYFECRVEREFKYAVKANIIN
jgi:hypothetical protein